MEGGFQLVVFSGVMLFGSYFSGSIPLYMSMSEEKLHLISVLGAGLLVGTALAVIIPEGMMTMLSSSSKTEDVDSKAIGVSLVLGFLFMLLIDQCSNSASSPVSTVEIESTEVGGGGGGARRRSVSWTTTLGLVVHAAADGIALGAAATTNKVDVEIVVFLAIMLHKAPAAFGLVTFLLHEGLDRLRIRRHLIAFSLSAPITALLTFTCLYAGSFSGEGDGKLDTLRGTGIAMLFSAGTFLYVATVHVLPEVTSLSHSSHHHEPGAKSVGFSKCELLMLTLGVLLPLVLTLGHHHHHHHH